MKTILTIFCIFQSVIIFGQKIKYPPKFFTLRNARIAVGPGIDLAITTNANSLWLKYQGVSTNNKLGVIPLDTLPLINLNLALDLYAPNSFISFYSEIRYSTFNFTLEASNQVEAFRTDNLDIPLYLKMRFGSIEKRWHLLWMLGGGYTIPLNVTRNELINVRGNYQEIELDNNNKQFIKSSYLGSMVGLECFLGKNLGNNYTWDKVKVILFAKFNYRMSNMINNDYSNFKKNSILFNYENFDLRESHFTIGASVFLRLNQLGDLAVKALDNLDSKKR